MNPALFQLSEPTWVEQDGDSFGARPDALGHLGGGPGYSRCITGGTVHVRTVPELLAALAQSAAADGQVIFVEDESELDFTDVVFSDAVELKIPAGVILAGNRGHQDSRGALLFSDAFQTLPLIRAMGAGVRVTGLRIRGPDPKRRLEFHHRVFHTGRPDASEAYYRFPNSVGIQAVAVEALEVDNCEISAWSLDGIRADKTGKHHFHHNVIHHCQRMGLGYGIGLNHGAQALIECNIFQDNKHSIASDGSPGGGYEARHNVVLQRTEPHPHPVTGREYGQDHGFDMHGGEDRRDGSDIAGRYLRVHHNTFYTAHAQAVVIRGAAEESAEIHHNWFLNPVAGRDTVYGRGPVQVHDNLYGRPPRREPLRGQMDVLAPISPPAPGRIRLTIRNTEKATVSRRLFPLLVAAGQRKLEDGTETRERRLARVGVPAPEGRVGDGNGLDVRLAPGEESVLELPVYLAPDSPDPGDRLLVIEPTPEGALLHPNGVSVLKERIQVLNA